MKIMKEQTPITAEEYWNDNPRGFRVKPRMDMEMISFDSAIQFAEQYAQYREKKAVLEALEREHQNLLDVLNKKPLKEWEDKNVVRNQVIGLIEQFHETEVKPKYDVK